MPEENPQVFIKVIPGGGTNTVLGLVGQFKYVTRERDVMEFNEHGQLEFRGKENPKLFLRLLEEDDIEIPPQGFRDQANRWVDETAVPPGTRDLTTHLVTSFPADTDRQAAKQAALDWADEIFRSGKYAGDKYNYAYAVHRDKDHLHVHFIINRRGLNGRWLKISNSSEGLHYDTMRVRMVPHALNNGIILDATSREERGIIERPITSPEYWKRATGRVKVFDEVAGVIAESPITPRPSRPTTPSAVRATPEMSPSASSAPQTPPPDADLIPPQSQATSRNRSPEPESVQHSSPTSENARRREDMREEIHLYGPQTETESSPSSSSSSSPAPSPAPEDSRRHDMGEPDLYGAHADSESSYSSSPPFSPTPDNVSSDARTKRNADAAELESPSPSKRPRVNEEPKRKANTAGLDSSSAPPPKRLRAGENPPNVEENTPRSHNQTSAGLGARPGSSDPQQPSQTAITPELDKQRRKLRSGKTYPQSPRRSKSSSEASAAGFANADTNQETGSAASTGEMSPIASTASNDAEVNRRRRRQQRDIEPKLGRTHQMETRAEKKRKQAELDEQKRKLRSGKIYDPIGHKSRKKDDGHGV